MTTKRTFTIVSVLIVAMLVIGAMTDFFGVFAGESSRFSLTITAGALCFDGIDNDSDGAIDYPADTGCESYADDTEEIPGSAGGGVANPSIYRPTPASGSVTTGESRFSGIAIPNALVRILENGVEVLTVRADADGRFTAVVTRLGDGLHTFRFVVLTDSGEGASSTVPLLRVGNEQTETIEIAIPPILRSNAVTLKRGDALRISGFAQPLVPVEIEVHSTVVLSKTVQTNARGEFEATFTTELLEPGPHSVVARSYVFNRFTELSQPVRFTVGDETVLVPSETAFCHADVNGDARVNLVDLSVLEVWFERDLVREMTEIEARCLSGDGVITPADLSILAYYWTG